MDTLGMKAYAAVILGYSVRAANAKIEGAGIRPVVIYGKVYAGIIL